MDPRVMAIDDIRQELITIMASLGESAKEEDLSARVELRSRQHHLRAEMAQRPGVADDATTIQRELVGLRRRLDQILEGRPSITAMTEVGEGGASNPVEAQKMVGRYDKANDLHPLQQRIAVLEQRLRAADAKPKS